MKENTTVIIPFRLRDGSGAYAGGDTVLSNYDIVVLKNGAPFVVTPVLTYLGAKGRHLLAFTGSTQDQYQVFIDHNTLRASIESAWVYLDRYDTIDLAGFITAGGTATDAAAAVWNALVASYQQPGSTGEMLKRILQLNEPDVVVDHTANQIILKDRNTGQVLITYDITGTINSDITNMDA